MQNQLDGGISLRVPNKIATSLVKSKHPAVATIKFLKNFIQACRKVCSFASYFLKLLLLLLFFYKEENYSSDILQEQPLVQKENS